MRRQYTQAVALLLLSLVFAVVTAVAAVTEPDHTKYSRSYFKHWVDADRNGLDTRQEVLIRDSITIVTFSKKGKVAKGVWPGVYNDQMYTDPKNLDIDHYVPLKEAWESGADKWSPELRTLYANYLGEPKALIAVYGPLNRKKGASDPARWLPEGDTESQNRYIEHWIKIKDHWYLCYDAEELVFIQSRGFQVDRECPEGPALTTPKGVVKEN